MFIKNGNCKIYERVGVKVCLQASEKMHEMLNVPFRFDSSKTSTYVYITTLPFAISNTVTLGVKLFNQFTLLTVVEFKRLRTRFVIRSVDGNCSKRFTNL